MGTQIAINSELTPERIDRGLELLRRSLPSLHASSENRPQIEKAVQALTIPAHSTWIMARVAALLNPYFEKDTPQAVREMEAADWAEELAEFPQWAIERAVRWWKSAGNPDRRRRPLEGDIAARCHAEMDAVYAARRAARLSSPIRAVQTPPPSRVTKEAAAEIMARAFGSADGLKRMGGEK